MRDARLGFLRDGKALQIFFFTKRILKTELLYTRKTTFSLKTKHDAAKTKFMNSKSRDPTRQPLLSLPIRATNHQRWAYDMRLRSTLNF